MFEWNLKKLLEGGANTFNNVGKTVGNIFNSPMNNVKQQMRTGIAQNPVVRQMPQQRRDFYVNNTVDQMTRPNLKPDWTENKFVKTPANWIHENFNQQFMRQVPKAINAFPKIGWGKNGLSIESKQPDTVFTPTNDTERFAFGNEPVTSWKKDYQTTKDFSKNLTGGNDLAAGALAVPLMGLAVMGDLTPVGGADDVVTKGYKAISKSKDVVSIAKTIKSLGITDNIGGLAKKLVNVTDPKVVAKTLNTFDQTKNVSKSVGIAGNAKAIKGLENAPTNAEGGKLVTLSTKDIIQPPKGVDILGQKIDLSKVNDIVNNFDNGRVNVKVFKNADGKYELLDGSHTLTALDKLGYEKVNATEVTNPEMIRAYRDGSVIPAKVGKVDVPINPSKSSQSISEILGNQPTQKLSPKQLANQQELPVLSSKSLPSSTSKVNNIIPQNTGKLKPEMDRKIVADNLQSKYDNFEKSLYGNKVSDIKGGTRGATKFQEFMREGREDFNKKIQAGLSSENNIIRKISRGIRGLFGSAGNTAERTAKQGIMRGGIDESRNLANDFFKLGDEILPDKTARERVWAVLDPELATVKVSEKALSASEKKAVETIRQASDLINDTNFSMGKISHETWLKGKDGKYITRAYEDFDLPPELSDAFQAGRGKLEIGGYKQRTDINDWKKENAIKDPFYLASKRIQSTFQNKSLTDYANWVNKQTDMVSDVPRAGYTTLSDSKMWGDLAGKNIRQDVLEGVRGFYSDNKVLQGLYDGLNAYDKFKPRQILKKTKTVYNPATRLGNQTSNRVFAMLNGINPITFEKNIRTFAKSELKNNGQYARLLRQRGILGTDMTKYELVKNLAEDGMDVSKLGKIDNKIASSYGAADDVAKLAALKTWLDRGKTVDEAIIKVQNGFQDYSKVGLFYDIGAKLPLVGKPFVRFQSELSRIIKNSMTENPLHTVALVGSIALIGNYASKLSGETPEDKETRENRFGTPVIPFTQIPLVFQTPFGEVNVARMFGMYETAGADTRNKNLLQRASKYLPFDLPQNKEDLNKMLGNDVMLGGIVNQVTDTDFRGKSISDPDATKFKPSTLTEGEKMGNRAWNAYHNYQVPFINDLENVGRSAMGMKDQYGREKTLPQSLSKLTGFKVEQFGPQQASEQRIKDMEFEQYKNDDTKKLINSVLKDQASGKIDQNTADKRIQEIQKKSGTAGSPSSSTNGVIKNPSGGFSYTSKNGDFVTKDTEQEAKREIAKIEFEKSGKNFEEKDGMVYRKKTDGGVEVMTKDSYDYKLGTAKLSKYKRAEDINSWMKQANSQLDSIEKQINDPNVDELDKVTLEEDYNAIFDSMEKYAEYGGFKKPKKGKSTASKIAEKVARLKTANETTSSTYKALQDLLRGTEGKARAASKQIGRKVNLRKITVKKGA